MLKSRQAFMLFGTMLLTISLSAQTNHSADATAIKAVLDAHGAAWTRGDSASAASVLTDDADWVSGSGRTFVGRREIEAMHKQMLDGPAKGTRHSHPGIPTIRFITPEVAIVDGNSMMAGFHDENGKEVPAEYSRYTAVFLKKDGKWYVTAFRSLPQVKVSQ